MSHSRSTREIRSDKNYLINKNLEKHKPIQNDIINMNNYSSNNSNNNIKEKTSYFDKPGANVNIFSQLEQTKYSIKQKTNNKNSTNHIRSSSVLNIKNNYNKNNPNDNYQYYLNKLKATKMKLGNNGRPKQEPNQHHKMNRVNSASKIQSHTSSEFNYPKGISFGNHSKKNSKMMKYNYNK